MSNFFIVTLLLSLVGLIIGLIKPSLFARIKLPTRKLVGLVFGGLFLVSFIGIAITAEPTEQQSQTSLSPTPTATPITEQENQQKQTQSDKNQSLTVISVVDGDTLKISSGEVVRLIGIDSPETKASYYAEAKNKLTELTLNKKVRLEKDISETDRYGRILRYIFVGNMFVNLEMVKQGYATAYTYPPDVKYSAQFVNAEKEARNNKLGLWSLATSPPTPTTSISTPTATPSQSGTYSLPPCASSDCDCGHFTTHAYAQWFHDNYDPTDKHRLDRDADGLVCESLT